MLRVGVRELKAQASEIVRRVREENEQVEVTYRGRTVAIMIPASGAQRVETPEEWWRKLEEVSDRISEGWPKGVSAVDAIRDVRREL